MIYFNIYKDKAGIYYIESTAKDYDAVCEEAIEYETSYYATIGLDLQKGDAPELLFLDIEALKEQDEEHREHERIERDNVRSL